ncbi:hypothetical protein SCH4B_0077 [Ruegeria sp. TrichCH4B]|nr:hypothetical protein SCH4B_0077 [Ruegeria sp. TrichCH4B]
MLRNALPGSGQVELDRRIGEDRWPAVTTVVRREPRYVIVEPDQHLTALAQRGIVGGPVRGAVAGWRRDQRSKGGFTDTILITAFADLQTAIDAMRVEASDFLVKPFQSNQILNTLRGIAKLSEIGRKRAGYDQSSVHLDRIVVPQYESIGPGMAIWEAVPTEHELWYRVPCQFPLEESGSLSCRTCSMVTIPRVRKPMQAASCSRAVQARLKSTCPQAFGPFKRDSQSSLPNCFISVINTTRQTSALRHVSGYNHLENIRS